MVREESWGRGRRSGKEVRRRLKEVVQRRGGRDQFFLKRGDSRREMDREMGNETEFETINGQKWETRRNSRREMGVNVKRDKTRYIIFLRKNKKNREKTGKPGEKTLKNRKKQGKKLENRGKNTKKQEKTGKKKKITRNTETSFRRGSGKC